MISHIRETVKQIPHGPTIMCMDKKIIGVRVGTGSEQKNIHKKHSKWTERQANLTGRQKVEIRCKHISTTHIVRDLSPSVSDGIKSLCVRWCTSGTERGEMLHRGNGKPKAQLLHSKKEHLIEILRRDKLTFPKILAGTYSRYLKSDDGQWDQWKVPDPLPAKAIQYTVNKTAFSSSSSS